MSYFYFFGIQASEGRIYVVFRDWIREENEPLKNSVKKEGGGGGLELNRTIPLKKYENLLAMALVEISVKCAEVKVHRSGVHNGS